MADHEPAASRDADDEYDGPWVSAVVECPICITEHVSVHPIVCEKIECPSCGYMIDAPEIPDHG